MKCTFCHSNIPEGRGKLHAKVSGHILYFCNSKCQKNFKLGRDGKNVRWTDKYAENKD